MKAIPDLLTFVNLSTPVKDLSGKTAIVTGGNSGIGLETARGLAEMGASVIIASRNSRKSQEVVDEIRKTAAAAGKGDVNIEAWDLDNGSFASVRAFADRFLKSAERFGNRLDYLFLNAGINGAAEREVTEDGHEKVLQVNHLSVQLLAQLLAPIMRTTGAVGNPARIIVTSSGMSLMGSLDLENIEMEKSYGAFWQYPNTKLMNVLFAKEFAKREGGSPRVTIHSADPGFVATNFGNECNTILLWIMRTAQWALGRTCKDGAATGLTAALGDEGGEKSGLFWRSCQAYDPWHKAAKDENLIKKFWEWSETAVNKK